MAITASPETVKENNVIICMIDEWNNGDKSAYDCRAHTMNSEGVNVVYLSGYRSRNDFVKWEDVVAKVDKRKPEIIVANGAFKGHFLEFKAQVTN